MVSQKIWLIECYWNHGVQAKSSVAITPFVWKNIFWSFLTKTKQDQALPSYVLDRFSASLRKQATTIATQIAFNVLDLAVDMYIRPWIVELSRKSRQNTNAISLERNLSSVCIATCVQLQCSFEGEWGLCQQQFYKRISIEKVIQGIQKDFHQIDHLTRQAVH